MNKRDLKRAAKKVFKDVEKQLIRGVESSMGLYGYPQCWNHGICHYIWMAVCGKTGVETFCRDLLLEEFRKENPAKRKKGLHTYLFGNPTSTANQLNRIDFCRHLIEVCKE